MSEIRCSRGASARGAGRAGVRRRRAAGPIRLAALTVLGGLAALAGGCVKQQPTTPPPPPPRLTPDAVKPEQDLEARYQELQKQSADFSAVARSLPDGTPAEVRDKAQRAFTLLTQLLPRLELGPPGGVFDHQLTVIELSRAALATSSPDLNINPVVDRGLRATCNALDDAQHNPYYNNDAPLRASLDQLNAKLPELDQSRGADHRLVWAEAFSLTSDAVSRMVGVFGDRLAGKIPEPTTAPAGATPGESPPTPAPPATTPPATTPDAGAPAGATPAPATPAPAPPAGGPPMESAPAGGPATAPATAPAGTP